MKKKVVVYGKGGRDQALAEAYADSSDVERVFFCPGTAGVLWTPYRKSGRIELIGIEDFGELVKFCKALNISLVDIGPEDPLEKGLVDILTAQGIPTIGPKKEFVQIESDREFTDKILARIGVAKPEWRSFTHPDKAKEYVRRVGYQVVVKANGLAAGKGAIVCDNEDEALAAVDKIMVEKEFEDAGNKVIVERRRYGTEISAYAYLDGKTFQLLRMFAQDYKPACDPDDKELIEQLGGNLNTGGTGCYCPHQLVSEEFIERVVGLVVNPFVNYVYNQLGWKYKGVLYFGLNLDPLENLEVFEINVRHGDPEWEVLSLKLRTDMFELAMAVWEGKLDTIKQVWDDQFYLDVVAMEGRSRSSSGGWNKGYPGRYGKGHEIVGLEQLDFETHVYFAGVKAVDDKLVTDGGRVAHVVVGDSTLERAREKAYHEIQKISFIDQHNRGANCMRFRRTIGI